MKLLLALVGVTFCFLGEHSRYLLVSLNDTDDVGESDVTGRWIRPQWVCCRGIDDGKDQCRYKRDCPRKDWGKNCHKPSNGLFADCKNGIQVEILAEPEPPTQPGGKARMGTFECRKVTDCPQGKFCCLAAFGGPHTATEFVSKCMENCTKPYKKILTSGKGGRCYPFPSITCKKGLVCDGGVCVKDRTKILDPKPKDQKDQESRTRKPGPKECESTTDCGEKETCCHDYSHYLIPKCYPTGSVDDPLGDPCPTGMDPYPDMCSKMDCPCECKFSKCLRCTSYTLRTRMPYPTTFPYDLSPM